jgi:hypothetical protein
MKAAAAAGGLAAVGYGASTFAASDISGSINDFSDSSESSDSSNSYGSESSSESSRICGGAGGASESSDSSSGFNCCQDNALEQAFRDLSSTPYPGLWSNVQLHVFKRSFEVVAVHPDFGDPNVEFGDSGRTITNPCTLSAAQVLNSDMWTTVITGILAGKINIALPGQTGDLTVFENYFYFNADDRQALEPLPAGEEVQPYTDIYFFEYSSDQDQPVSGLGQANCYGRREALDSASACLFFFATQPAYTVSFFLELVEPYLSGQFRNVANNWLLSFS